MAEYQDDLALIVRYDGTKAAFDNVRSNYKNKVVFIYGSEDAVENQAGLVQAIWVGDSTGGRYLDMANVGAIKDGLTHIAGFAIDGAMPEFSGGANGINFKGAGDITISLKPANATDNEGVPYWTIEVDGGTLKSAIETAQAAAEAADDKAAGVSTTVNALIGDDKSKTIRTIAAEEAAEVSDTLLGAKNAGADTETIRGVKKAVNTTNQVLFGKPVPVSGDKILTDALPDVIMGQLKFGGTIGNTKGSIQDQELQITPSADLDSEFDNISSSPFAFTPTKDNADDYKGWYFIVAKPAGSGIGNFKLEVTVGLEKVTEFYEVGDWLLSTGIDWVKIDNTDAVVRVAGMQGDITTEELVNTLSTENAQTNADPLAKKSEITLKGVKAADASKEYISVVTDAATKEATITVGTASMSDVIGEFMTGADALATAKDVFNFIKARLSIKVVK
jgi:hypothetical protein